MTCGGVRLGASLAEPASESPYRSASHVLTPPANRKAGCQARGCHPCHDNDASLAVSNSYSSSNVRTDIASGQPGPGAGPAPARPRPGPGGLCTGGPAATVRDVVAWSFNLKARYSHDSRTTVHKLTGAGVYYLLASGLDSDVVRFGDWARQSERSSAVARQ